MEASVFNVSVRRLEAMTMNKMGEEYGYSSSKDRTIYALGVSNTIVITGKKSFCSPPVVFGMVTLVYLPVALLMYYVTM